MNLRKSSFVRSRWHSTAVVLALAGLPVVSCISTGGGGGGAGGSQSNNSASCPLACGQQASHCVDGGSAPSTSNCVDACNDEAQASGATGGTGSPGSAQGASCGSEWNDFVDCCSNAQGAVNCSASNSPALDAPGGCSTSCAAVLEDYRDCAGSSTPAPGNDGGGNVTPVSPADSGTDPVVLPAMVVITGIVRDSLGTAVANAEVSVGTTLGLTDTTGMFTVMTEPVATGLVLQLSAIDLAPQIVRVPVKPGVTTYSVPAVMQRIQSVPIAQDATLAEVPVGNGVAAITFEQPMAAPSTLRFVSIPPEQGPGDLRFIDADPDQALQSGGMMWFELVDEVGAPIPMPAAQIAMDVAPMVEIPEAEPWQGFVMDEEMGQWAAPDAPMMMAGTLMAFPLPSFGFWNLDRNFRTACVTGTISDSAAASCGGGRVQATGPDGLSSSDSIGMDGSFCVTGAQTFSSSLQVGGFTQTVNMPSTAGDCSAPATCFDLGEITVPAGSCGMMMDPRPGTVEVGMACTPQDACVPGSECFNGFCVGIGTMRVSLAFSVNSDFDLHLTTPAANEIYFGNRTADGGTLDVDQCVGSCAGGGVENIVFTEAALSGTYDVWVINFNGLSAGDFTIEVSGDVNQTFSGTLPAMSGAASQHFMFTLGAAAAVPVPGGGGAGGGPAVP